MVSLLEKLLQNPLLDAATLRYEMKKPFRVLADRTRNGEMLPIHDNSRTNNLTLSFVWPWTSEGIGWDRVNQRRARAAQRLQQGWPNPIPRARLYQEALKADGSYGRVAARFGVSREEVCHYVTLVTRLPVGMVDAVEGEQDPLRQRQFSLRALLGVARLRDQESQAEAFGRLWSLGDEKGPDPHYGVGILGTTSLSA